MKAKKKKNLKIKIKDKILNLYNNYFSLYKYF